MKKVILIITILLCLGNSIGLGQIYLRPLYEYKDDAGKTIIFQEVCNDCFFLYSRDSQNQDSIGQIIKLPYYRYSDEVDYFSSGAPCCFEYVVSPNGEYLYVITRVMANSSGVMSEFQLFKVDCKKKIAEFITDGYKIQPLEDGFKITKGRLTNEEDCPITPEQIWMLHEEYYDWDGNRTFISDQEYLHNWEDDI